MTEVKIEQSQSMILSSVSQVLTNNSLSIRIIGTADDSWFSGKDIAKQLGYKQTDKAINDHVTDESFKAKLGDLTARFNSSTQSGLEKQGISLKGNAKNSVYINKRGLEILCICSRLPNKSDLIHKWKDEFGINCDVITRLYKEQETIGQLCKAFARKNPITQFRVSTYKIDLYFPDDALAIECDEFGHQYRNHESESIRENTIKQTLNCRIYRFNPDSPNFCIFNVIDAISTILLE